ncbi:hypothetical protein A2334_05355 [Candidatus Roizmanbacteria bacterium RIFOXYB2_FULL_38_10]|uniref:Ribosomal RNA large subunit methyltransferase K/L-like methyltransferase domain-containing protein n=1 Tax=Candidatus Roizmanbacteria bacterium RIFOXYD1_FULL_38_12 TaxID=1802093 RepID=A0A1F7L0H5_9BACT|nr:MAG: hypothetical protein A3K47_02475 [Candidatus Roizmanbacteria bacterium RIFOXYA2_FULL_38_14]OGK63637.1 MAG: hypothetical protein A3K27_02475 [Candidatus Roizmanbacteria bacterium RIFOXYA1_FULL_37_12]OGK65483.1 MAG: hypothetical protein A3K38_02475 [Candidatus Roizmanbacteria bacterium RIFOXYB1_FULL_40_23]OGK68268.1 MAG: hypothetical protein A2334_05355 [Candidatus Roizmanbacteria bacterium RIFOXYB2_FULL_38_10]OGK69888.1 MAG: hypothetical protein A3K21_02480 [Candidatus Roizmanbacteria ba
MGVPGGYILFSNFMTLHLGEGIPLPLNAHKAYFPKRLREFCLGTQKLELIFNEMTRFNDINKGDTILIPFGGPGSMTNFFDYKGISTITGDIKYHHEYKNPYKGLKRFRRKYKYNGQPQHFIEWDAKRLPLKDASQKIAIVNPPYGRKCPTGEYPIDLSLQALAELDRVLIGGGVAYFIIPRAWQREFWPRAIEKAKSMKPQGLYINISNNPFTEQPLSLIRFQKI